MSAMNESIIGTILIWPTECCLCC